MVFEQLQIPIDADNFEPLVEEAKSAKAAIDGYENERPKDKMNLKYVSELLAFIATGQWGAFRETEDSTTVYK